MRNAKDMLTPREAAARLGVSYPTVKKWILSGKLKSTLTAGRHHRISVESLDHLLLRRPETRAKSDGYALISGRNQLVGTVMEVRIEGLLAQVVLAVGDQQVTSIITADSARALNLRPGDEAIALVKATEVMIARK